MSILIGFLLFMFGFLIGHYIVNILRFLFVKFLSLKFKESKYKNLFNKDDIDSDFWDFKF